MSKNSIMCTLALWAAVYVLAPATAMSSGHTSHLGEPPNPLLFHLVIFVLSGFVGYYVVWSVTPALHTPLMAVTNAISSVIVVGALLAVTGTSEHDQVASVLGLLALFLASINIFGGFMVTRRMLAMFRKRSK